MRVFRAPGRVNLIGEHTDHSGGFVVPAAIDRYCEVRATPAELLSARSTNLGLEASWDVKRLPEAEPRGDWSDYVCGVAREIQALGVSLSGAHLEISSTVPLGAGMSSSAAIEVSVALALLDWADAALDRVEIAKACLRAEKDFVGLQCGIMDQFISLFAREGEAMLLDCRSLEHAPVPVPAGVEIVLVDSGVKHELAGSEYNRRRADYEEAERLVGKPVREMSLDDIENHPEEPAKRARHIIEENTRALAFRDAATAGDLERIGSLMRQSHLSLANQYEVSCAELDSLANAAWGIGGVIGARMMGGGFGGCTINLVRSDEVDSFRTEIAADYASKFGRAPEIYVCRTANGAREVG